MVGQAHSRLGHPPGAAIPAIVVDGLSKSYGRRKVVDGVSFQVEPGEIFALLGPNGAGKTTTVEILEGYRAADTGSVRVLGLDPRGEGARLKRHIGLMLQQGGVYPQMTPREALRLFAAFYPEPEDPEVLLARVGLGRVAATRFRRLSGGEKQRLGLALALVGRPHLVFLDEPTAAMDPQARHTTWDVIRELKAQGVTVLLTTHFMDEAEQLADRVAIIDRGHLVALDTPAGLRRSVQEELRVTTDRPVAAMEVAAALGLAAGSVASGQAGLVLRTRPTPRLVADLAGWLASQGVLLTGLQAGSRSLEQAFLEITASPQEHP